MRASGLWLTASQQGHVAGCCEDGNGLMGSTECGGFLDYEGIVTSLRRTLLHEVSLLIS